jgi:Ca2+-binding EF-hand superfamily protein
MSLNTTYKNGHHQAVFVFAMGNQQYQERRSESSYSRWNTPQLQQVSGIDASRLPQFNEAFRRAAGSDGLVSRDEFEQLYRELNRGSNDQASIDRSFRAFDRDGSGKLSFDEFLSATVMLNNKTGARERVSYLIDSNNPIGVDHTYITPDYGRSIVRNLNSFYGTNANFDEIWSNLNANNGQVRREEFVSYISQAPTFVRYF